MIIQLVAPDINIKISMATVQEIEMGDGITFKFGRFKLEAATNLPAHWKIALETDRPSRFISVERGKRQINLGKVALMVQRTKRIELRYQYGDEVFLYSAEDRRVFDLWTTDQVIPCQKITVR